MNDSSYLHACVSIGSGRAAFAFRFITHGVKLVGGKPLYVCDTAFKSWSVCGISRYRPAVMRNHEGRPPPSSRMPRSAGAAVLAAVANLNQSGLLRNQIGDDAIAMLQRIPVDEAYRLVQELRRRARHIHKPGRWLIAACTDRVASQIRRWMSARATRPQTREHESSDCEPARWMSARATTPQTREHESSDCEPALQTRPQTLEDESSDCDPASHADMQQPACCCSAPDSSNSRSVTSSCVSRLVWTDDAGYTWLGFTNPESGALWWWCESSGEWLYDTTLYSQPRTPEWTAYVDDDPQRLWWRCTSTGEWYWDIRHHRAETMADTSSSCAWQGRGRGIGRYRALDKLNGRGLARPETVPWTGRGSGQRKRFLHHLQGRGLARTLGGAIFGVPEL